MTDRATSDVPSDRSLVAGLRFITQTLSAWGHGLAGFLKRLSMCLTHKEAASGWPPEPAGPGGL